MSERPSEFELIAKYFAPLAGEGAFGLLDDAAVISMSPGYELVVTKDILVAGIHFFPNDSPDLIARKALRVNLSDLAAKGAKAKGFLLGLGLPAGWQSDWLEVFASGLATDCNEFECALLGGDTVKTSGPLTISITAFGKAPVGRMIRRTTAQAGDVIFVTGTIGDAALGLQARLRPDAKWLQKLSDDDKNHLAQRYLLPRPRTRLAEAVQRHARAAMDISDGLVGDLAKMLAHVGARVDLAAIPFSEAVRAAILFEPALDEVALTGGDDYELLIVAPLAEVESLLAEAQQLRLPLTRIGDVVENCGVVFCESDGSLRGFRQKSFVHF